jgi:hypothetical protein
MPNEHGHRDYRGDTLDGLQWLPIEHAKGWLVRDKNEPHRFLYVPDPDQWVGALVDALSAAAARSHADPRIAEILATMKRLISMSQTTQGAVDHVAAAIASMKAEVQTDVGIVVAKLADLAQQIADLKAAGSGATSAQIASLEASATDAETTVKALHDGLNPTPVTPPAPPVFDSTDPTPNSPGGRNSDQLPGFDPAMPVTA